MRLGEVLCLTHADWHPGSGGTPFIEVVPRDHPHGARVKGGRGRRIYVSDELERLYGDYLWDLAERAGRAGFEVSDEWFCFVNLDGEPRFAPMRPERVYRITGRLRHRLPGLPEGWSPHWLRHTHASALPVLNAGVPIHVVQRYMGHVSPAMTMYYAKTLAETHEAEFLRFAKLRRDGRPLEMDPADVYELVQLDRHTDRILPNGVCLLPPPKRCDRGNACSHPAPSSTAHRTAASPQTPASPIPPILLPGCKNYYQLRTQHPGRHAAKHCREAIHATSCDRPRTPGEGIRVGQALGLRHCDFVSRSWEVRIVPRPDNANGARAKLREAAVIPVSTPLVRLYSEYMHAEYGDLDCDYVFVNLFGGRTGQPLRYPTVHRLAGRIAARTGIAFTAHMLRHYVDGRVMWPEAASPLVAEPRGLVLAA